MRGQIGENVREPAYSENVNHEQAMADFKARWLATTVVALESPVPFDEGSAVVALVRWEQLKPD